MNLSYLRLSVPVVLPSTFSSSWHNKSSKRVKLAYHPATLASYAIKIMKPTYTIRNISGLEKEITILSALKHPNIVNLVQVYESIDYKKKNGNTYSVTALVFELVAGGDLFEYIMSSGRFSENTARTHFRTLIESTHIFLHWIFFFLIECSCAYLPIIWADNS